MGLTYRISSASSPTTTRSVSNFTSWRRWSDVACSIPRDNCSRTSVAERATVPRSAGTREKHDGPTGWRTVRCGPMLARLTGHRARIRRTKWIELSCLLCGESAATLESGSVLRPRATDRVRVTGARVTCGGSLSKTDQASASTSCEQRIAAARRSGTSSTRDLAQALRPAKMTCPARRVPRCPRPGLARSATPSSPPSSR